MEMVTESKNRNSSARTLIYIPILHTRADMGTLSEPVQHAGLNMIGRIAMKRKEQAIVQTWMKIEQVIYRLGLSYEGLRLYQDGLPVCGREDEIVKDLAARGSRNHMLLLRLREKGAILMGTESPELLVEEYNHIKKAFAPESLQNRATSRHAKPARQRDLEDGLLKKRDSFIADRINKTLQLGETGILFLGMLHSLGNHLDNDIKVIFPVDRPARH